MGEEVLTVSALASALARYHREILMPDMEQMVDAKLHAQDLRLAAHFDELYKRLERLESEYHALTAGLKRVEERLDRVEARLDKMALKSELLELKARVEGLQAQVRQLEDRLSA